MSEIIVHPSTEGGPHPELSWEPVPDAVAYWLVLQRADGEATWAWTGSETSTRVGGGASPDLNQTAAVHAEMQWVVTAFDANDEVIAISAPSPLRP